MQTLVLTDIERKMLSDIRSQMNTNIKSGDSVTTLVAGNTLWLLDLIQRLDSHVNEMSDVIVRVLQQLAFEQNRSEPHIDFSFLMDEIFDAEAALVSAGIRPVDWDNPLNQKRNT